MKILILFLFLFFQLNAREIPLEEKERIALVAEQMELGQSQIWPTLDWKEAPLIVTFGSGDIFAFNLVTKDPVWKKISIGQYEVLYTDKDKWGALSHAMQSEFEIEGQRGFLYQMGVQGTVRQDVAVLAHERFHRHQMEKFTIKEGQGRSLDHLSEENLTWGEIEDHLLRDFLQSSGEEKREYLKDFIAVNQMRREAIDPLTRQWENGQLRMEGLADYVAAKAYGGEAMLLAMHPEEDHEDDFIDEAIKWRHYMAGAAIGFALDFLKVPNWQAQVQQGVVLPDLLYKSMPIDKPEQNQRIKKIQERVNYKKRRKGKESLVDRHLRKVDALEKRYAKIDGIPLFLGRPPVNISGGGANDEMVYLDSGSIVALNDSSVAATSDGKWKFETSRISHLYQHAAGVREVKLDKKAAILINGVWFALDEIMENNHAEYPFKTLKIECRNSFLDSQEHKGVLVVDQDTIFIRYL